MYKLTFNKDHVKNINNCLFIPLTDPANTDYAHFKKEINEDKVELQDAAGNTLTAAEAKAFVATLP